MLNWLIEDILRDFLIDRFRRLKSKKSMPPSAQGILRTKRRKAKRARARSRSKH